MVTAKTIFKKIAKETHRVLIKRRIKFIKKCIKFVKSCINFVIISYAKITYKFYKRSGVLDIGRETPIIVTLTSYGPRLATAYLAIHTLLCQRVKPDRVILWLAHGEKIPENLTKLCQRGLEIKYCDDLKSYKKIIPPLKSYPDAILVTADDDIVYKSRWLEKLYKGYLSDPKAIWAHRVFPVCLIGPEKIMPYLEIPKHYKPGDKHDFLYIGSGAGLIIPPGVLPKEVLNITTFQSLCYSCDDTWITAMMILKGIACKVVKNPDVKIIETPRSQSVALWPENLKKRDSILHAVFTHFNLYERLYKHS